MAGCVAGALGGPDFVRKLEGAGVADIHVAHREPLGVDDCALYPLFPREVIDLLRTMIPAARQPEVAVAVEFTATRP